MSSLNLSKDVNLRIVLPNSFTTEFALVNPDISKTLALFSDPTKVEPDPPSPSVSLIRSPSSNVVC